MLAYAGVFSFLYKPKEEVWTEVDSQDVKRWNL